MIKNWEIFSNIDAKSSSIHYSLLIDGTEQDARLVARKLKKYVRPPKPALAPYIYNFPLDNDLDEDVLEKIRAEMQQIIVYAEQLGQVMPGGTFATQLYVEGIEKEDKAFPTFITLDPSESAFQDHSSDKTVAIPAAESPKFYEKLQTKFIDLDDFDRTIREIAQTRSFSIEKEQMPVGSTIPPPPGTHEISLTIHPQEKPQPPQKPSAPPPPSMVESSNGTEIDLSFSNMEPFEPAAPAKPNPPQAPAQMDAKSSLEASDSPSTVPTETSKASAKAPERAQVELDDIFLAETKYDMFMDFEKELPEDKKPKTAAAAANAPLVSQQPAPNSEDFNIFEQKIKDQTCFMDVEEVSRLTERITEKDLSFVEHAKIEAKDEDLADLPDAEAVLSESSSEKVKEISDWATFKQPSATQEVMDPFEQLLATSLPKKETTASVPPHTVPELSTGKAVPTVPQITEKPIEKTVSAAPQIAKKPTEKIVPVVPPTIKKPKQQTISTLSQIVEEPSKESGITRELKEVFGSEIPMENNMTTENTGESNKKFIHLKRKEQPANVPVPPRPVPPAPVPAKPTAPAPEEDVHSTILRRKRAVNPLEKTTTIDHSIEVPLSELKKYNWPIEVPLVPTYTLENMTISINRFAHATAISVIENPGKLYNPLVLHGSSGTGKTHFLHVIGYALSNKFGQENVFITNGVRLSRGIQRYIMEGNIQKFEEFTADIKALLIDDIHLISINEQNRSYLSKLLNDFRSQHKQIVITSKYPPENLAKLEELLNFKLDSGWISDLKQAQGPARTRIIQKMLNNSSVDITNEDASRFFGKPDISLGSVSRSIRRVRVLQNVMQQHEPVLSILNKLLAINGEDSTSLISKTSIKDVANIAIEGDGEWGRIGIFYPQNHSDMLDWLIFALQQRAKELRIPGGMELAIRSSYSTENIISSAFKIANLCDNRKLKGAVILGPSMDECDLSVRENFYDIITHMLEIMLIRCGVINFEDAALPSTYVKTLAELIR